MKVKNTFHFDLKSKTFFTDAVKEGLEQLKSYLVNHTSNSPRELVWEIRLYEWILAQPDAEAKAEKYFVTRHAGTHGGPPWPKRYVVEKLGWEIK
jgi:hypothetical protein